MSLTKIIKGIQPEPFRLLIHGTEGIGKSTFSACAPDPIFIQTEDGLSQIDVPRFPLAESFDAVLENLNALLTEKHSFQTVIIDSVDWLEKKEDKKVLETYKGKASIADIDYGRGYAMLIPLFEAIIDRLNQLRREQKMNIVCVAHSKLEKIVDPTGASYDQYAPRLDRRINGLLREWCDLIIFASIEISRSTEKDGFNQRVIAKAVRDKSGNDRVLILESTPAIVAKSRYRLPVKMPLDGEAFFATLWEMIYGTQQ
jgi:predicted CopG family antitoxin